MKRNCCAILFVFGILDPFIPAHGQGLFRSAAAGGGVSANSYDFEADTAFVGRGEAKRGSIRFGDFTEISSSASLILSRQIQSTSYLRLGIQWLRNSFDTSPGTPVPDVVRTLNLVVGSDFQVSPAIIARVDLLPGLYGDFQHPRSADFDMPAELGASWFYDQNLIFVAGLSVEVNRDIPVFPAAGVHWKISDKWTLEGILPRPELQYSLSDHLTLFAGGAFNEVVSRASSDFGRKVGIRKLDNAILDYTEIRVGGGLTWAITKSVSVSVDAGVVPYRRFDYQRADYKVLADDPVPYCRIGISASF